VGRFVTANIPNTHTHKQPRLGSPSVILSQDGGGRRPPGGQISSQPTHPIHTLKQPRLGSPSVILSQDGGGRRPPGGQGSSQPKNINRLEMLARLGNPIVPSTGDEGAGDPRLGIGRHSWQAKQLSKGSEAQVSSWIRMVGAGGPRVGDFITAEQPEKNSQFHGSAARVLPLGGHYRGRRPPIGQRLVTARTYQVLSFTATAGLDGHARPPENVTLVGASNLTLRF
jgi:hypothetical protein